MAGCLETPDDNDTTAGEHGSRSGVRGVLQRGRELQGIDIVSGLDFIFIVGGVCMTAEEHRKFLGQDFEDVKIEEYQHQI